MISALVCTLLFGETSRTKEIAKKLSMLEYTLSDHRKSIDTITYDPFHPGQKMSTPRHSKKHTVHTYHRKHVFKPDVTMILNKKAFINGKWYKEKSKFADYVIYKISEDTVFFRKRNKVVTAKLSSSVSILTTKEE